MLAFEALLRAEGRYSEQADRVPWRGLATLLVVGSFVYGFVMGGHDLRLVQSLYSASKVPLLLVVSTLICLPSFYVLNAVLGLRDDFEAALRGIVATQATLAVTLAALAPVTAVLYVSATRYESLFVVNGVMFALATLAGQHTLQRHYRRLVARRPLHRVGRLAWGVLYTFVAVQLAWVLRPFIGAPGMETRFLRDEAWSNAYVHVARELFGLVSGGG